MSYKEAVAKAKDKLVLILVVMEYTQWVRQANCLKSVQNVLILVVMEYTQWEQRLTYPLYKAFWFIISMTAIVI